MAFSSDAEATRGKSRRANEDDSGDGGWTEAEGPARDWKKLVLVIGLGGLSWVATYVGMLELIEANMGDLPLVHKVIIGFSVAMLMTMIVWLLDQMFSPVGWFTRLCYAFGYLFLTIISVGFGFGFYWKVLESRSESSRSAESAVGQVQGSLHAASTRLEQLQATLDQLTEMSKTKAEAERANGNTCPGSKPGDGPRRKLREDDAGRFAFAADFVKGRVGQVKTDMGALDGDLARIVKDDKSTVDKSGTRNEFMKALGRKLDMTVTGFNAFRTDPQLKQLRADLSERAEKTTFPDSKGSTYACPDGQLQTALRGVVRAIDQLPELEKPKIAAVEGSEATIEAFRRLTATFYGLLSFKLPPSADEMRALQQKAVQQVEGAAAQQRASIGEQAVGLSKRDYVPLAIAVFVDLCLLLVSMGRSTSRLHGLVPRMKEAERGPFYQIVSKFNDIHKDPETRDKFEMFRHVVFDFNGDYYVAVPLDAPYRLRSRAGSGQPEKEYTRAVEDLQREAHLLANLFASFEKERIFSRVYNPLLTTRTIQRKLWRQGSKYAGSHAFRVYRFRDGAWSEIILNVVLGAARRVEADKRARRRAEGPTLSVPRTGTSTGRTQPPMHLDGRDGGNGHRDPETMRPAEIHTAGQRARTNGHASGWAATHDGNATLHRTEGRSVTGWPQQATVIAPNGHAAPPAEAHDARFGPYAGYVPPQPTYDRGGERPQQGYAPPVRAAGPSGPLPPSHDYREIAAAMDAYTRARSDVREADVTVQTAANSNTAPHARPAAAASPVVVQETAPRTQAVPHAPIAFAAEDPMRAEARVAAPALVTPALSAPPVEAQRAPVAQVIELPVRMAPAQDAPAAEQPIVTGSVPQVLIERAKPQTMDVVISRETATFSVPVSEAAMPQALSTMLRQAVVTGQAARRIDAEIVPVEPAPAPRTEIVAVAPLAASVPAVRAEPRRRPEAEIDVDAISQRFAPLPRALPAE